MAEGFVLFCIIPMIAWVLTLVAMKGYTLTGKRMEEIQAVNGARKAAIEAGMPVEEAMERWKDAQDLEDAAKA